MRVTEQHIREAMLEQAIERITEAEATLNKLRRQADRLVNNAAPIVELVSAGIFDGNDGYTEKRHDFASLTELVASLVEGYTGIHGSLKLTDARVTLRIKLRIDEQEYDLDDEAIDGVLSSVLERSAAA